VNAAENSVMMASRFVLSNGDEVQLAVIASTVPESGYNMSTGWNTNIFLPA